MRLLQRMDRFVREQAHAFGGVRMVLTRAHENMCTAGERIGGEIAGQNIGLSIVVNAHLRQIRTEAGFNLRPRRQRQWVPARLRCSNTGARILMYPQQSRVVGAPLRNVLRLGIGDRIEIGRAKAHHLRQYPPHIQMRAEKQVIVADMGFEAEPARTRHRDNRAVEFVE